MKLVRLCFMPGAENVKGGHSEHNAVIPSAAKNPAGSAGGGIALLQVRCEKPPAAPVRKRFLLFPNRTAPIRGGSLHRTKIYILAAAARFRAALTSKPVRFMRSA